MANIFQKLKLVEPVTRDAPDIDTGGISPPVQKVPYEPVGEGGSLSFATNYQPDESGNDEEYKKVLFIKAYADIDIGDDKDVNSTIYKVEEIIRSLPSTLPMAALRESVLNILESFHVNAQVVAQDAELRMNALRTTLREEDERLSQSISDLSDEIENAKETISRCEESIASKESMKDSASRIINGELTLIKSLLSVIVEKGGEKND